jgi:hypothetical protein
MKHIEDNRGVPAPESLSGVEDVFCVKTSLHERLADHLKLKLGG